MSTRMRSAMRVAPHGGHYVCHQRRALRWGENPQRALGGRAAVPGQVRCDDAQGVRAGHRGSGPVVEVVAAADDRARRETVAPFASTTFTATREILSTVKCSWAFLPV